MMRIGDLVTDEYHERGIITNTENYREDGYVEVTFFGGIYGTIVCEVNRRFLTLISRGNNETT